MGVVAPRVVLPVTTVMQYFAVILKLVAVRYPRTRALRYPRQHCQFCLLQAIATNVGQYRQNCT